MPLPRACLLSAALVSVLSSTPLYSAEPVPEGWFEWPYVEPKEGSALDTSDLNGRQPAGALGRVQVKDGVFVTTNDGQRIRFWGCNLSAAEAFPDAETAKIIARRLAKGGINIARLHHLDNPWAVDSGGSLWKPGTQDRIQIDPAQLDKVHRLVAELKAQGIYSNVNLKVSRTHTEADGFPPSIAQTPGFQKRVDYFSRRIVDLQKDFARQLLTTVNRYTGLSLAEDPAVAVIEINNENSLLGLRTREAGDGLELLPEPFRGELTALWNAWLARRYENDEAIGSAWAKEATRLGRSALTAGSRWRADAQPGNEVIVQADSTSEVHIDVRPGDGVRWRSAAYLDRLDLIDGATYTLTFAARASAPRPVEVAVGRDEAGWRTDKWRSRGLRSVLELTPEWREFRLVFTTHSIVDVGSRLTVIAGHAPGEIWLKELRLESGSATAGLRAGQSARAGTIPIPTDATPAQWNDYLSFLSDTEQAYVAEMRAYLRDEVKTRAPIVCTQSNYGGIAGLLREKASDFIDTHTYWQHPDFAGVSGVWNTAQYTINNTPELGEFSPRWFGELGALALLRVTGKPFTVTEVDHPAPSEYASEMYPILATFAGLQDWDGLFTFDMVGIGAKTDTGALGSFFDQSHHPAKWGFGPFATRVFRQGWVPLPKARRELRVASPVWREANHLDVLWLKHQPGDDLGFLTDRLSVSETLLPSGERSRVQRSGTSGASAVRLHKAANGPVYVASTAPAATLVGYLGGASIETGDLAVDCESFGLNFGAVTAVALDGSPLAASRRVLLTLAARAQNQGSRWNAARTSVGDVWGKGGPTIAERIPATLRVKARSAKRVYALAPDGSRAAEVPAQWANGWLRFSTREGPATLHYEMVAEPASSGSAAGPAAAPSKWIVDYKRWPDGHLYGKDEAKADWPTLVYFERPGDGRVREFPTGSGQHWLEVGFPPGTFGGGNHGTKFAADLAPSDTYTVEYAVRFPEDWEFSQGNQLEYGGGKLPGLTGGSHPTGGHPRPDGMSARPMWRRDTRHSPAPQNYLELYLYWRQQSEKYGDRFFAQVVEPGRTYRIKLRVDLGTAEEDGHVRMWVDEQLRIERAFRFLAPGQNWKLTHYLHDVFYGGNGPDWAPKNYQRLLLGPVRVEATPL